MSVMNLLGTKIPDFSLKDQNGKDINIEEYIGKKNIVVYFYPKADTPGCTIESCTFRDEYEEFLKYNCEVIGISSDSIEQQSHFSAKHKLPFKLLSDVSGKVRKKFQVSNTLGFIPGRTTFVVNKKGIIRHIFNSQINIKKHVAEALKEIKSWE